jgi:hypothetical protein
LFTFDPWGMSAQKQKDGCFALRECRYRNAKGW